MEVFICSIVAAISSVLGVIIAIYQFTSNKKRLYKETIIDLKDIFEEQIGYIENNWIEVYIKFALKKSKQNIFERMCSSEIELKNKEEILKVFSEENKNNIKPQTYKDFKKLTQKILNCYFILKGSRSYKNITQNIKTYLENVNMIEDKIDNIIEEYCKYSFKKVIALIEKNFVNGKINMENIVTVLSEDIIVHLHLNDLLHLCDRIIESLDEGVKM